MRAQAPQGPPKPGPEVKRLAYFVGNWKEEGKSTAHGMAGPVSSTQEWEWVSGGFFIVGHSDNKSPVGDFKIMAVLGYDPETKTGSAQQSVRVRILRGFLKSDEFGLCGGQALRLQQQIVHVSITAAAAEQSFDVAIDRFHHTHRYLRPTVVQDAIEMIQ